MVSITNQRSIMNTDNQQFDWTAWDKMLEEAHTQEEYHKVIQALPDYPRPDEAKRLTTLLEKVSHHG